MLTQTALTKAIAASPEYKALVLKFQKESETAARTVRTKGYTFSDGSHLDFTSLVVFVQSTLAVKSDTSPAVVFSTVEEARKALGTLMPAKNKWKGLQALLDK